MWALVNQTPFAAERNWTRSKTGVHVWIVALKATFDIAANGALKLADEQIPPVLAPEYHGKDPATSSLKYESDLLAVKPGTDVLINGQAHAPGGRPAPAVEVLFRLGDVRKHLVAYGKRAYYKGAVGLTTTSPAPFTTCPLIYEDAFGGSSLEGPDPSKHRLDKRNPVGKGVAANVDDLVHQPAHRVEYASGDPSRVGPAGFGPLASYWSPRLELAGTYDATWDKTKKPLLPDDYDPKHVLCSPLDQRPATGWLKGGELVELAHMTPEGSLRFELPRLSFSYDTWFGRRREEHRGHLATVIVEPDERRLMAVYQSSLTIARRDVPYLDKTVIDALGSAS
jgi:hypothetical protein